MFDRSKRRQAPFIGDAMPTTHEVERLVKTYRRYTERDAIHSKWDETNLGYSAILRERQSAMEALLRGQGLSPLGSRRVLDVGCGSGKLLASMLELGARPENLYGVDLLPDRIATARERYPTLNFQSGNAERLLFPDSSFELVLLFTVFSSILDDRMARNIANEVFRVLRPGGYVLWYDFRYSNPSNVNVRGVTLPEIHRLFPDCELHVRLISVLPPLARRLGRLAPIFYPVLGALPALRTHYLALLAKPALNVDVERAEGGS